LIEFTERALAAIINLRNDTADDEVRPRQPPPASKSITS
jgi:hypothetical protein